MLGWTFEVLITADNNLFSIVDEELTQFQSANPRNVNVVVQVDTPHYRTRRHVLNRDGRFVKLRRKRGTDRNLNSGYKQTLIDFMIAAKNLRPAQHTFLVLNGHGTGITDLARVAHTAFNKKRRPRNLGAIALGIDDTSHDFLDNNELASALTYVQRVVRKYPWLKKPAIIGCDACLMASVELAHHLATRASYFVASQDNEPVEGWPYREILKTFNNRIDPRRAAVNVVESYGDATKMDDEATLSAVDLGVMKDLAKDLDGLGDALLQFLLDEIRVIARAREDARAFANFDSIDLHGFVEASKTRFERAVADSAQRQQLTAASEAVLTTLGRAVIATSKEAKISGAHGLSAYIPNSRVIEAYHHLPLSKAAPRWHRFVEQYGENRDRV